MSKTNTSLLGLALAAVLFLALNVIILNSLTGLRLDLTEGELYSLSDGAVEIVAGLEEEVRLELYFSQEIADDKGIFTEYGRRVSELLEEFVLASEGKLLLEVIDPVPFSEAEDDAVAAGVSPMSVRGLSDPFYFGLSASGAAGERRAIGFFDESQESLLEYDIARLIHGVENPIRPVVGLLSSLPLTGNPMAAAMGGQPEPAWAILSQLEGQFEVRQLRLPLEEIPRDVDVLWVVHPQELGDRTRYTIDQFVLGGGRALVMVDPFCFFQPMPQDPQNPGAPGPPTDSGLPDLLAAWGLELVPGVLAADREHAQSMAVPSRSGGSQLIDAVVVPLLDGDCWNRDDPISSQLQRASLAFAGVLRATGAADMEVTPLLSTGEESMQIPVARVTVPGARLEELLTTFLSEGRALHVAVRSSGRAVTAFPDGPPTAEGQGEPEPPLPGEHLTESAGPIQVIAIADCDILADQTWVQVVRQGPRSLAYRKTASNGDFVLNALDSLGGSDALISLRGRARFARPFDRVEELRRAAEERHLREQQNLEAELDSIQQRLFELQQEKSEDELSIITPEQLAEIERYRREELETRKKLRDVRHDLRKDIDSLGTRLKWINTALVPLLVTLIAAALGLWRFKRGT